MKGRGKSCYPNKRMGFIEGREIREAFGKDVYLAETQLQELAEETGYYDLMKWVGYDVFFCVQYSKNGDPQARALSMA